MLLTNLFDALEAGGFEEELLYFNKGDGKRKPFASREAAHAAMAKGRHWSFFDSETAGESGHEVEVSYRDMTLDVILKVRGVAVEAAGHRGARI